MDREPPPTHPTTPEPTLVLIVDDEAIIAEMLADIVTDLGYTPLLAANGRQALALMRVRWPALVITDLMMPQMNGVELIAALRAEAAERQLRSPPVLLLTAGGARAIVGVDADVIMHKPFDIGALERVLRSLLDSFHA